MKKRSMFILSMISCLPYLLIVSNNSPLYKLNDWCDPNIYLTVAKGMRNGMVLYKDIFDHKGPITYFLGVIADIISPKGYTGLWIQEMTACIIFVYFALKLIVLFKPEMSKKNIIISAFIISSFMFCTPAYISGYSVEEICLPLMMISIYITLKTVRSRSKFSMRDTFILGLCAGVIFWIKFTILGLFIGIFIVIIKSIIEYRKRTYSIQTVLSGLSGILTVTLIPVGYFVSYNKLIWLYKGYIESNLFSYAVNRTAEPTDYIAAYTIMVILSALIMIFIKRFSDTDHDIKITSVILILSTIIAVSLTVRSPMIFTYYYETLVIIVPIIIAITSHINKQMINTSLLILTACILTALTNSITYMCDMNCHKTMQEQFSNTMHALSDDPTLIIYGFSDTGFYRIAGIDPTTRETSSIGIINKDICIEHLFYIENAETEFLITNFDVSDETINKKQIDYHQVDYVKNLYSRQNDEIKECYLYQRNERRK